MGWCLVSGCSPLHQQLLPWPRLAHLLQPWPVLPLPAPPSSSRSTADNRRVAVALQHSSSSSSSQQAVTPTTAGTAAKGSATTLMRSPSEAYCAVVAASATTTCMVALLLLPVLQKQLRQVQLEATGAGGLSDSSCVASAAQQLQVSSRSSNRRVLAATA